MTMCSGAEGILERLGDRKGLLKTQIARESWRGKAIHRRKGESEQQKKFFGATPSWEGKVQ